VSLLDGACYPVQLAESLGLSRSNVSKRQEGLLEIFGKTLVSRVRVDGLSEPAHGLAHLVQLVLGEPHRLGDDLGDVNGFFPQGFALLGEGDAY
jgi:hypothetical protein